MYQDIMNAGPNVSTVSGAFQVEFRIFLPNILPEHFRLQVLVIHQNDQFTPGIMPEVFELQHAGSADGLWQASKILRPGAASHPQTSFGAEGVYYYRYRLLRHDGSVVVRWVSDPYAKESGPGTLSAFTVPQPPAFAWTDHDYRTPQLRDLVIYECMVDEFAETFDGLRERLDYIQGLGVTCIELMPITNVLESFRWGYMPLSHFAIEERYGGVAKLKALVNECHARRMAVIHDAVYAHAHPDFLFYKLYWEAQVANPMIGPFAEEMFGEGPDFRKDFTKTYFRAVNMYFLEELHFDGFRYDYVPGYYAGPATDGYAALTYETYRDSEQMSRFASDQGSSRIIQLAEFLEDPIHILKETYSSSSKRWELMRQAQDVMWNRRPTQGFVDELTLSAGDWPAIHPHGGFPVAPVQFVETHDKSRLILYAQQALTQDGGFDFPARGQNDWFRLQPVAIGLFTAPGIPMLWQGQEFGEAYGLPESGWTRVLAGRPLNWSYFYEEAGYTLVTLYRRLGKVRQNVDCLRSRNVYVERDHSLSSEGSVVYRRFEGDSEAVVMLNFSEHERQVFLPLRAGQWKEAIYPQQRPTLHVATDYELHPLSCPPHFGVVYVRNMPFALE